MVVSTKTFGNERMSEHESDETVFELVIRSRIDGMRVNPIMTVFYMQPVEQLNLHNGVCGLT